MSHAIKWECIMQNAGSTKWQFHWGSMKVKLELKLRQMWSLISQLMDTFSLCFSMLE